MLFSQHPQKYSHQQQAILQKKIQPKSLTLFYSKKKLLERVILVLSLGENLKDKLVF